MNRINHRQHGMSLIELMIAVTILAILTVIAVPAYNGYIERGYQTQAQGELLKINTAFRNRMLRNPRWQQAEVRQAIRDTVRTHQASDDLAAKYQFGVHDVAPLKDGEIASSTLSYTIFAIPRDDTGYRLSVWMDSSGNAFKCSDINSARQMLTRMDGGVGCEPAKKRKRAA